MDYKRQKFGILCMLSLLIISVSSLDRNEGNLTSTTAEAEDEVVAFKRFEDRIVSLMKNLRRQVFPFLARAATEVTLASSCSRSLSRLYSDLIFLKSWALKLMDSSGKIPSGILKGSMAMLGNYDECLEITVPPRRKRRDPLILGKYCLTFLYVPNTLLTHLRDFSLGIIRNDSSTGRFKEVFNIISRYKFDGAVVHSRFGVCIPSTCSEKDLSNILKYALTDSGVTAEIRYCEVKTPYQFRIEQILILCVFGSIAALVFVATIYDCCFPVRGASIKKHSSFRNKMTVRTLLNFSISSNMKKLFSDECEAEKCLNIPPLRGAVVIAFCFYVVANSYAIYDEHAIRSYSSSVNYFSMLKEPLFAIVANSAVFLDSIFAIAGFQLMQPISENDSSLKVGNKAALVKGIFRYILPILLAISVFLLLPVFGDGPAFREVLDAPLSACRRNWWTNILFFNNFLKLEDQCMLHTWLLGCVAQVLIIGFVFKWTINRWPWFGLASLALFAMACNVSLGVIAVQHRLPPVMSMYFIFSLKAAKRVTETIFFLPHSHMGSFAAGMYTSYWIQRQHSLKIRGVRKLMGWITFAAVLCCLVFGLYPYHDGTEMTSATLALFASLHGTVIGATVSLALVILHRGDSDVVSRALSSKYFLPLRKLMYYAYLLHWTVVFFHIAIARERTYLNHYEQISRSFGHILAVFILAFVFHIFFNGIFTLDEVMITRAKDPGSKNGSSFKGIFAKKKFQVQSPEVYQISGDFAMQSCKYANVPEKTNL